MNLRYLVDTDCATDYLNGEAQAVERLDELQPDGIGMSMVSLAELWEGIWYSRDREGSEEGLRDFLRIVTLLPLEEEACKLFGKERGRLRGLDRLIGDVELLVGATALSHDLTLLTNNRRHSR